MVPSADPARGSTPMVSIGLPVYNGENYLRLAIDSVLAQTFGDFELVITDNASTDATSDICNAYAAADSRIRYIRNSVNLGAAPNYNMSFELSCGKYFKWFAHDDIIAPTFLEKTVTALEAEPDAVVCAVDVHKIGPADEIIGTLSCFLQNTKSMRTSQRFAATILDPHPCTDVFGLVRREAMARSSLHGAYRGSDRVLIAELALMGRFVRLPEPLLLNREHHARYTQAVLSDRRAAAVWLDTRKKSIGRFDAWRTYGNFFRIVNKHVTDAAERRACYIALLRWLGKRNGARVLMTDLLWALSPRLFARARQLRKPQSNLSPQARPQRS